MALFHQFPAQFSIILFWLNPIFPYNSFICFPPLSDNDRSFPIVSPRCPSCFSQVSKNRQNLMKDLLPETLTHSKVRNFISLYFHKPVHWRLRRSAHFHGGILSTLWIRSILTLLIVWAVNKETLSCVADLLLVICHIWIMQPFDSPWIKVMNWKWKVKSEVKRKVFEQ